MTSRISALLVAIGITLAVPALLAHHSAAMFDDAKVLELTGVVKEMQWANPHIWIQVIVDDNGTKKEWSLEGGSPNTLSRRGWRSTSFTPGDKVTLDESPMKDGTAAGLFIGAKFAADGHTIGRWD